VRDWIIIQPSSPSPVERRITEYCERTGIPRDVLMGRTRRRAVAWARQELMLDLHILDGLSFAKIGRKLNRDHTTVMHGVRAAASRQERKRSQCMYKNSVAPVGTVTGPAGRAVSR